MARDLFEEAGIVMAPAAKQGGRDLFEEFGVAAPAPDRPERSALRGAADVALEVVSGGIKGIKFISDAAGADNVVSRGLGAADDAVKGLQSPLAQYEDRQVSQIMREAEDKGGLEQAGQALRAAGVAPVRMSLGALATGAPVIAASMIPGVREASWGARLAAMGTLGATQGAGVVKSSIYEGVRDRALQEGLAQDEAQAVAERAQRYTENPGLIAGGAALGAAASATGFERSVAQILGRKAAEQAVARSAVGSVAKGVVKEAPLEATQGGQERYATNVATDRAGFETPAFRGVVGSATLEGTLSAPGGAIGGALDYAGSRRQPPAEGPDPAAEPAATPVADQPSARPTLSAETVQATAQARLDALERKANGTPEQTVVGPDGAPLVVPGEQPQYLNLEERRERTFLRENLGEPQRLADGLGVTVGTAATPAARLVELDLLSQVRGLSEPERAEFDALLAQFDQEDADGGDGAVPPVDPGAAGGGAADDATGMGAGVGVDGRPEPGVVGSGPAAGAGGEAVPPGRDAERAAVAPEAAEIVQPDSSGRPLADRIRSLVGLALSEAKSRVQRKRQEWTAVSPVDERFAQQVAEKAPDLDVSGYRHILDEDAIRKVLADHGSEQERQRGQIPVTEADFELTPQILSNGTVESIGKTKNGLASVTTVAQIGDQFYYVEEIRTGRNALAMKTMWKRPARSAPGKPVSEQSPEALAGPPPQGAESVAGEPGVAPITREAKLPLGSTVYDGQGNPWRVQNRRSGILTLQPIVGGTPDTKAAQRFVIDQDKAPANSGARVEPLFLQAPAQGPQAQPAAGEPVAPAETEKEARERRASRGHFASQQGYQIDSEDRGSFGVTVSRLKDGGVLIDDDGQFIEYNADFARGKSDEEILRYSFEPVGFRGARQSNAAPVDVSPSAQNSNTSAEPVQIPAENEQVGGGGGAGAVEPLAVIEGFRQQFSKMPSGMTPEQYRAFIDRRNVAEAQAVRQLVEAAQSGGLSLPSRYGGSLMMTPEPTNGGATWRVTRLMDDGAPAGHMEFNTPELAAANLLSMAGQPERAAAPEPASAVAPTTTPAKPPKRTRQEAAAARRQEYERTNPFKAFLAKHGVNTADRSDVGGERRKPVMVPYFGPMFRNNGMRLDELALLAVEAGFLTQSDIDSDLDNGGVNKLADMIQRTLAGERVKRAVDYENDAEAEYEARAQAYYEAQAEAEQALVDEATDDEINALLQLASQEDAELSTEEIDYIAGQEEDVADEAQGTAAGASPSGDPGSGAATRAESAGEVEPFALGQQTEADVSRQEAQRRLDEAARQRQAAEQARRDAAPPPEEFTLAGSDRAADLAAARGQMELGGEAPVDAAAAQSPSSPSNDRPEPTEAQKTASSAEKKLSAKLDDVGEQLYANRRNFVGRGLKWDDVAGLNDTLKVKEVRKAKVWPKPDYEKLIADGMPAVLARMVKHVYDGLGAAPTLRGAPTDGDLRRYIDTIGKVREAVFGLVNDRAAVKAFAESALALARRDRQSSGPIAITGMLSTAQDAQALAEIVLRRVWPDEMGKGRYERFKRGSDANAEALVIGGNRALRALQFDRQDFAKWAKDIGEGWPASREAWQVHGYRVLAPGGYAISGEKQVTRFNRTTMEAEPTGDTYFQVTTDSARKFWRLPTRPAEGAFLLVDQNGSLARQFESEAAAIDAARELVKREKGIGQDDRGTNIAESERTGPARRQHGENVSGERMMEVFGFRGVNFGREGWIKQAERQAYLNAAYDGLLDLAELLNVPPKAMSLDGALGIAFGAQGKGAFAAHFMPGVNEINLTKTRGAGTLAHEWGHALDHYFATQAGLAKDPEPMVSEHAHKGDTEPRVVRGADGKLKSESVKTFGDGLRPEIVQAFRAIVQAMSKRPETEGEAKMRQARSLAQSRSTAESWLKEARRAIENSLSNEKEALLAEFDRHADAIRQGEPGDGYVQSGNLAMSPRVADIRETVKKATTRLLSKGETENLDRAARWLRNDLGRKEASDTHEPQRLVSTDYDSESSQLDAAKSKTGKKRYWSTPTEMFARAFETYVHERLVARGQVNTFLTNADELSQKTVEVPDMSSASARGAGATKSMRAYPYPRGVERETINKAFDTLIGAIQTRETDTGVAMFSRSEETRKAYEARIDALFAGEKAARVGAKVLDRSDMLDMLGLGGGPVHLAESKVLDGRDNHPRMTAEAWKKIPQWIEDPAAVFESDTVSRRLTFIAPETVGGAPVIVIVEPNVDVGAADLRVHILVNAYDKDGGKPPFGRWMRDGLARYVDQKKFPTILAQAGLQLPSTTQNKPGTRKILTEKNLAGYRRAAMSRGAGPGLSVEAASSIAAAVRKAWANGPEVVVVADMADQKIPQAVRDADAEQRSRGATGEPEGFFYGGKVYLVAGQLATPADVVRVLSHEALGHYGLRGLFGDRLAGILDQIGLVRRTEVMAKRQEYGLPDTTAGRRVAAEEVLSVMAQTNPQLGFVRRAVAAIRTWLRGLGLDLRMTDDEIIRSFILPARQWVQRGGARPAAGEVSMSRGEQVHAEIDEDTEALLEEFGLPAGSREEAQRALAAGDRVFVAAEMDEQAIEVLSVRGLEGYTPDQMLVLRRGDGVAFSRSAMKSPTANMDRGLKALAQAITGRTTVHRAMFRNGLGWVDFVWGDEGTVKSDGRTKGAKGLSHIVEARMRKDGLTEKEAIGVLSEMVRAIAAGGETKRRQVGRSVSATFEHDGYRVALVKTHGANAWVVTAFEIGPDARPAGYATAAPTQTAASLSRDGMGAGPVAPGDTVPSLGRATRGDSTNRGGTAGAGSRDSMAPGREDGNAMFSRSTLGNTPPPSTPPANRWQRLKARAMGLTSPEALDKLIYELQDKFIDLKRIRDHIAALGGTVNDLNDAYLGEELYHKRLAKRTQDFLNDEVKPLLAELRATGTGIQDFERFLHARHAPEANRVLAERNPNQQMIDARRAQLAADVRQLELDLQRATARGTATKAIEQALDTAREQQRVWGRVQAFRGTEAERNALSGMSDDEAQALMDGLPPGRRQVLESLAARVDAINGKTLDALQSYGLMDRASLDAWRATYQFYVPLHRDEAHADSGAHPIGQGYLSKGDAAKRRTGSTEQVTNILSHVVMQREAALTRGEKARVGKQLYLLAAQNPDPSLWQVDKPPKIRRVDEATGTVVTMVDPLYKQKPNVLMVRIGGKDAAIVFNERNPQAMRLAEALRNLDVGDLHFLVGMVAKGTRWFASVNTQYNPIFGLINFARDLGAGVLNLSTTPLAGKERQVAHGTFAAMRAIYRDTRGKAPANAQWARLWQQMQDDGGTTGYRDLFVDANDRAKKLQRELGALDRGQASKAAHAALDWLSAYNETMENAVRLAAYKEALDMGMSRPRAASLAKNLTVNFNRKGRQTREAGAFYAFFNAAIQGNTRMFQTLLGPAGKKIMLGGVMLGAINTLLGMAVMGGGDEDEWEKIPEFIKERSIIIPVGRQDYVTIPMPLGFHVLPNIGRTAVEMMLGDPDKTPGKMVGKLLMTLAEAFNPLGSSQDLLQMAAPTVIDPVAALTQNRDWTGRPIYRPDYNSLDPTPGPQRAKDTASTPSRVIAELLNMATGGTDYRPGAISWTPDQIDYVFGQLTGGIGRELLKLNQTVVAPITGEELPAYKIPLVGRIYGNTRGPSAQSERFYENVRELNEIENELRGRAKAGQDVQEVLREEPLARLIGVGNAAEQQIRRLREQRRAVSERAEPGYRNEVAEINERIGGVMAVLNRQVREAKRAEAVE